MNGHAQVVEALLLADEEAELALAEDFYDQVLVILIGR
jgi:hypothetical protein